MPDLNNLPALPCACAALRRASRAVTQLYDHEMRSAGLRPTQFSILQVLETRAEANQREIGRTLALDATTLTRTLKLIESEGWIAGRVGKDRRERYWKLTRRGKARLSAARPAWERAQDKFKTRMAAVDWEALMRVADKAAAAATRGDS